MKKLLYFVLSVALFASCGSKPKEVYMFTSFHEPADEGLRLLYSYDGKHWDSLGCIFLAPTIGSKVMRDPSIVRAKDGVFHLVWTCGWRDDKGFGYASSKDLITWSEPQFVPVMEHEPTAVNVWAPELFYDDEADLFIIIWATTIPFRFEKGIEDELNNHRMYYTTTKDFKTFSETKLFLDPNFSVIDAVIVKRAKRDYVLVLKDNTRPNRNMRVAFADNPLGPYSEPSATFTPLFTEGPTTLKLGDEYYIYFDAYREKKYGAVKTKDFVTFTDAAAEVSLPNGHKHGTIFMSDEKVLEGVKNFCAKCSAEQPQATPTLTM